MIYEIATLTITPGQEAAFEAGVAQAAPLFLRAKGCRSMQLQRTIEDPTVYQLLVSWETLENHTVDFRNSADFQSWRALVGAYFASPPKVVHVKTVLSHGLAVQG
jgi:heme-degrading monooxygenase HmoA